MAFTKLDRGILQSSMMAEPSDTFKVWVTLLAACDPDGIARISSVFISTIAHLPMKTVTAAIKHLSAPDPESRSRIEEGRRIRRVDGGFEVINYRVYRSFSLRDAEAERKRLYRERKKSPSDSPLKNKEKKKKKKERCPDIVRTPNPEDIRLVQLLVDLMGRNNPKSSILKRLTDSRQAEWINQCRLLREADGKTPQEIERVIAFSQTDNFWKTNILSMPKVREKWDQLFLKAKGSDPHAGIKEWLADKEKEDAGHDPPPQKPAQPGLIEEEIPKGLAFADRDELARLKREHNDLVRLAGDEKEMGRRQRNRADVLAQAAKVRERFEQVKGDVK